MKVEKPSKPGSASDPKTRGTLWAEANRTKCDKLSDAQREKLMERAMQVIAVLA